MAPLSQLLTLPFLHLSPSKSAPSSNLPRTGSVWGDGPNTTLSYYYPVAPSSPVRTAFSTGSWPRDRATVPKTIYECDPPASRGFEARMYTCWNEEIDLGVAGKEVVVPGTDVKEVDAKELVSVASAPGTGAMGAPERIREWQLARAEEAPQCDERTGLAAETLHWGVWQHNCFDGASEWAVAARKARREVLVERVEKGYEINVRVRRMWEEKTAELKWMEKEGWRWDGRELVKKIGEREESFWKESFVVREEGRTVDGRVGVEFETRMKREWKQEIVTASVREGEKEDTKMPVKIPEKWREFEDGKELEKKKGMTDLKELMERVKKATEPSDGNSQGVGVKLKKVKVKLNKGKGKDGKVRMTVKVKDAEWGMG